VFDLASVAVAKRATSQCNAARSKMKLFASKALIDSCSKIDPCLIRRAGQSELVECQTVVTEVLHLAETWVCEVAVGAESADL
jgi:hypothetical protein